MEADQVYIGSHGIPQTIIPLQLSNNYNMYKWFMILAAVTVVSCQYAQGPLGYKEEAKDEYAEPNYSFHYAVNDPHTGDIKWQKEERKGDLTKGAYYLVEPDGSKRTVEYHVEGKSGFLADVHREAGKGGYEQPSYPKPSYEQPSYAKPSYEQPKYPKPTYRY